MLASSRTNICSHAGPTNTKAPRRWRSGGRIRPGTGSPTVSSTWTCGVMSRIRRCARSTCSRGCSPTSEPRPTGSRPMWTQRRRPPVPLDRRVRLRAVHRGHTGASRSARWRPGGGAGGVRCVVLSTQRRRPCAVRPA